MTGAADCAQTEEAKAPASAAATNVMETMRFMGGPFLRSGWAAALACGVRVQRLETPVGRIQIGGGLGIARGDDDGDDGLPGTVAAVACAVARRLGGGDIG